MSEEKLRNSLRPGHKLHWYQIEKVLGQGGFGITYLAYDSNLDHHVAIKEYLPMELAVREGDFSVYPASHAQDDRYRWGLDRFLAEARTLAKFKHPAIVRVLSVFESNNTAYMVMEYQEGRSLQQILERRRTLPEPELAAITRPLLDGLELIHASGFIHRDVKPSNIFVHDNGHPVLLDFGSARQALGEQTQTLTSVVSPGYAPFEQYYSKSDRQGPWTDIYGLGATLYRSISGLQPMAAIDRSEAILKAERDVFVTASEIGEGRYSPTFLAAVDASLHFNEKKRPQTIAEWRALFDFDESAEFVPEVPARTEVADDERTRFSALADEAFDVTTGAMFRPETGEASGPGEHSSREASARDSRRRASGPPSGPRPSEARYSDPRQSEPPAADPRRSEPRYPAPAAPDPHRADPQLSEPTYSDPRHSEPRHSEPRHSEPRYSEPVSGRGPASEPRVRGPRSEPQSGRPLSAPPPAPAGRRLWPLLLLLLLTVAAAAGWYFRDADFLPEVTVTSRDGQAADRLTQQGDRALAAGQVFEPFEGSALEFYQAAWAVSPGHPDARHGLEIAAERLAAAIRDAIAAEDVDHAFELARTLSRVPREVYDASEIRAELASARGRLAEANRLAERIDEYLESARTDIEQGRLVGGGTANALAKYRAIQVLDPDNEAAAEGVRALGTRLAGQAEEAFGAGEHDRAADLLAQARQLNPDAPAIADVQAKLEAVMSEEAAKAARAKEIAELLEAAQADIAANRLSSPGGRNALERYRRVLQLDGGNPAAKRGIEDIHDRYVAQATQALGAGEFAKATNLMSRARLALPRSPRVEALEQEMAVTRDRLDREEAARLAAEAQREIDASREAQAAKERAAREAEAARKRAQEEKARQLLAEAQRKAAEEAREQEAAAAFDNAQPRLIVDFYGFEHKFRQYYLTIERIEEKVYPLLRNAGYELVKRDVYHDYGADWTNVRMLVYKLYVNENTATGLYSYIGSVHLLPEETVMMRLSEAIQLNPIWTRGQNGLGPPTDLRYMIDRFTKMTEAFIRENRKLLQP